MQVTFQIERNEKRKCEEVLFYLGEELITFYYVDTILNLATLEDVKYLFQWIRPDREIQLFRECALIARDYLLENGYGK